MRPAEAVPRRIDKDRRRPGVPGKVLSPRQEQELEKTIRRKLIAERAGAMKTNSGPRPTPSQ